MPLSVPDSSDSAGGAGAEADRRDATAPQSAGEPGSFYYYTGVLFHI
ncbi:hypothetical protein M6D81_08665 [Paenibacillus sp. J5C_2022]|nr:hypothetical protein [Paenibacillus sp. J5C2022]MCU6708790.1 hypothetical protein [Paenibacillus sp. J5C2022]